MLPVLTPTDFVALANQTLEFAYPSVEIEGEVLNFKVSRNKWVYFDIADDFSKLRCFGTVYLLPGPIEDGMKVRISAAPRLHQQFGFSLNIQSLMLSGEGTIKKAADLLFEKLNKEGLFALERKRLLPYPPQRIGLITSSESAAYKDFIKVLGARWGGLEIELANVQVQGDAAPGQIVRSIEWFNRQADIVDVLVIIRGGGSADDLQAFSTEQVTRAVAGSRIPTLVAIGHEQDISLAELAADQRASTPSNAAELLVPDRKELLLRIDRSLNRLEEACQRQFRLATQLVDDRKKDLHQLSLRVFEQALETIAGQRRTLDALSPHAILRRGYAVVRRDGKAIKQISELRPGYAIDIQFADGHAQAEVQ